MTIETQTITITSPSNYSSQMEMIDATSLMLKTSEVVDDVAMYVYVWETMDYETTSEIIFSNDNTITITRSYNKENFSAELKEFYQQAKQVWEDNGLTVEITYT